MSAYLEITLKVDPQNRSSAVSIYNKYRQPFLEQIKGALTKSLLVRDEDVQVLHGFENAEDAQAYLISSLFNQDVARELKPLLDADPEVRIYSVMS